MDDVKQLLVSTTLAVGAGLATPWLVFWAVRALS